MKRVLARCGPLLVIVACLVAPTACDQGNDDECPCDAGADGDTDSDSDADTDPCAETWTDFQGAIEHGGAYAQGEAIVIEAYEGIQGQGCGYGAVAGLYLHDAHAGDYEVAATNDLHTCDECILLGANCSIAVPSSCSTFFLATEGSLALVMIVDEEPWNNWFEFVAEDLVLVEHVVEWESGAVEPVPNGQTMCIDYWHIGITLTDMN
jgi:hypothetical protein